MIQGIHQSMSVLRISYELLVGDVGSMDGSGDLAKKEGATVIRSPYKKGNGAAAKAGIQLAKYETLLLIHGGQAV